MCGICGIISYNGKVILEKEIKTMCSTMVHRGPDEEGIIFMPTSEGTDTLKAAFGHRRLSIIDLQTGRQPIHNEDKTIWVTCNGEIYNFLDLKRDLINEGHKFYTNSDTEVIVHCYENMERIL